MYIRVWLTLRILDGFRRRRDHVRNNLNGIIRSGRRHGAFLRKIRLFFSRNIKTSKGSLIRIRERVRRKWNEFARCAWTRPLRGGNTRTPSGKWIKTIWEKVKRIVKIMEWPTLKYCTSPWFVSFMCGDKLSKK